LPNLINTAAINIGWTRFVKKFQ